jgi:hypothetical protein
MFKRILGIRSSSKKSSPPKSQKSVTKKVRPEKTEDDEYKSLLDRYLLISRNRVIREIVDKYNVINDGKKSDKVIGKEIVKQLGLKGSNKESIKDDLRVKIDEITQIIVRQNEVNKQYAKKRLLYNLQHIHNIVCNHFATIFSPCDSEYDLTEEVLPDVSDDSPISEMKSPEPKTKRSEKLKSLPRDLEDKYNDFLKLLPRYKKDLKKYKEVCIDTLSDTTNPDEIRKFQSLLQVFTIYDTNDKDLKGGRKI